MLTPNERRSNTPPFDGKEWNRRRELNMRRAGFLKQRLVSPWG